MFHSPPGASSSQSEQPVLLDLIDPLKGLAIAAIVLVHTFRGWFGWQGVHIFILLSGFLLSLSLERKRKAGLNSPSWWRWIFHRCSLLLPSYWLAVLMGAFLLAIFQMHSHLQSSISWNEYLTIWIPCAQNFDYRTMFADPNAALWYVPFALSCYLVFPILYRFVFVEKTYNSSWWLVVPLLSAALFEFAYRAIAIAYFDGKPVGFGQGFLWIPVSVASTDHLPAEFPFQLWAPFGFSPSRVGELMLGVVGARLYLQSRSSMESFLFARFAPLTGFVLWLAGNYCVYLSLIGWVFADFLIAFGLLLFLPFLLRVVSLRSPLLLGILSNLGRLSLPLFLTHLLSGYTAAQLYRSVGSSSPAVAVSLVFLYPVLIVCFSLLVQKIEHWRRFHSNFLFLNLQR